MPVTSRITPCLWSDDQAETAANFYTGSWPPATQRVTQPSGPAATACTAMRR